MASRNMRSAAGEWRFRGPLAYAHAAARYQRLRDAGFSSVDLWCEGDAPHCVWVVRVPDVYRATSKMTTVFDVAKGVLVNLPLSTPCTPAGESVAVETEAPSEEQVTTIGVALTAGIARVYAWTGRAGRNPSPDDLGRPPWKLVVLSPEIEPGTQARG